MSPAEQLPGKSPRRIATLDGWRAVAIFFVILDHACQHTRFHEAFWARLGNFGVDIFFVVSGYIITSRLLEERRQTSAINLSNFYRRRTFRILPIVVTYLCALLLLSLRIDLVDFHRSELVGALCFFRNYQLAADVRGIFTAHFWSLSIEEHFYLLWPGLLVLLGNRRALFLAMAGAVTSGALRTFELIHPIGAFQHMRGGAIILRTEMRLDGLMLGSAAAILLTDPRVRTFIFRNFPKETPLMAMAALFVNLQRTGGIPSFISYVLVALSVASTLIVEEGLMHRFLNLRPVVWIGVISYSLYVWQELFLQHPGHDLTPLGTITVLPVNLVALLAVATASYYMLEQPMIRIGNAGRFFRKREMAIANG